MGASCLRPVMRALFFALTVFIVQLGSAWAVDPAPVTCAAGQWMDNVGECHDACKEPYSSGTWALPGEAVPTRICLSGDGKGVTVSGGGGSSIDSFGRPSCWHYTSSAVDTLPGGAIIYGLYTNPRDTCTSVGVKECGKLGCAQVEAAPGASTQYGVASTGKPTPVFEGTLSSYSPGSTPYGGGWATPGGVTAGGSVAKEYCDSYGYQYPSLCEYDPVNYNIKPKAGAKPQQDSDQSVKYLPSPYDVNCNYNYTNSFPQVTSGTCVGTFLTKFDGASNTMWCSTGTKNRDYSGPQAEGYNAGSASPSKACLLSQYSSRSGPVVGSTADPNAVGVKYPMTPEFYPCEYTLTKPAGTTTFVYRGTGASCGVVGSMGTSAGAQQEVKYVPAPDDYQCEDGHPRDGWSNAKCNGQYVPVDATLTEASLFFGRPGTYYVKLGPNGQVTTHPLPNGSGMPSGYSYNSEFLNGDPSVGTKPAFGSSSGSGSGSGLGGLPGSAAAEMPSTTFETWYTPKYADGPKGVWTARIAAVKNSAVVQYVKAFAITGGAGFAPHWTLDFTQMGYGIFTVEIPSAVMLALRYFVLVSAGFTVRKLIFGG